MVEFIRGCSVHSIGTSGSSGSLGVHRFIREAPTAPRVNSRSTKWTLGSLGVAQFNRVTHRCRSVHLGCGKGSSVSFEVVHFCA